MGKVVELKVKRKLNNKMFFQVGAYISAYLSINGQRDYGSIQSVVSVCSGVYDMSIINATILVKSVLKRRIKQAEYFLKILEN